jgi:hypothetical protein
MAKIDQLREVIHEMHTDGGGLFTATAFTAWQAMEMLARSIVGADITDEEHAVIDALGRMKQAMCAGSDSKPLCGCDGCPTEFSEDGEFPGAIVLIHAQADPPRQALVSAVCWGCAAKPGVVVRVAQTIFDGARVVSREVGHA